MFKTLTLDANDLTQVLENYRASNQISHCKKVRDYHASKACRQSVMIGEPLEDAKMKTIVGNLGALEHPWACPHGRPTIRLLAKLE
jgi:DNA mismatch repair protein PMS2